MQAHTIPLFKSWVPEWLVGLIIISILMTCLFSFAFYSSPATVMGFYGVQPTDVQYAMVVLYGSTVAFLALDFRIVKYFSSRKYLLTAFVVNAACSMICFHTRNWTLFIICQFVQGITCALMSGIVLTLTFSRLHSTRARVIGYTVLYAGIQTSAPLYSIYASTVLHFFDFNWLFYGLNILLIILASAVPITMNSKARFHKKMPLYQTDWIGYLLYTFFIMTLGYSLIYGRQFGWFDSPLIISLTLLDVAVLIVFISRELKLKRPLINLRIFSAPNFVVGLVLLFVFYIFKGSTGLTYGYLETILGTDPLHTIPVWISVILGTGLSMFLTARFILVGANLIRMIIFGFVIMALYYIFMLLSLSVQGSTADFLLPMFMYGVATGVLFVPVVSFTISAAPPKLAFNASLIGIFARFCGFTSSLALNNEMQLYTRSSVREKVRETLTDMNPQLPVTLLDIQHTYLNAGKDLYTAKAAAEGYFNNLVKEQILARATRDYYELMLIGVVCTILTLLFLPGIKNVVLRLRKGNVPY